MTNRFAHITIGTIGAFVLSMSTFSALNGAAYFRPSVDYNRYDYTRRGIERNRNDFMNTTTQKEREQLKRAIQMNRTIREATRRYGKANVNTDLIDDTVPTPPAHQSQSREGTSAQQNARTYINQSQAGVRPQVRTHIIGSEDTPCAGLTHVRLAQCFYELQNKK